MTAVIVAAGTGSRLEAELPKPYILLADKPILWYSLYSFEASPFVEDIVVVISPEMEDYANSIQDKYFRDITKFAAFAHGGETRQQSVYNVLQEIKTELNPEIVAIHDAARPFLKVSLIEKLYKAACKTGGAAPGLKVTDTIKEVNSDRTVKTHLKRENLIAIQTPQVFAFSDLLQEYTGLSGTLEKYTDDTEIFSEGGGKVEIIEGDPDLFKITYKNDLERARQFLEKGDKPWI